MEHLIPQTEQVVIQFGPVKQRLEGHRFDSCEAVEVALCKGLQMQQTDFYSDGILN